MKSSTAVMMTEYYLIISTALMMTEYYLINSAALMMTENYLIISTSHKHSCITTMKAIFIQLENCRTFHMRRSLRENPVSAVGGMSLWLTVGE